MGWLAGSPTPAVLCIISSVGAIDQRRASSPCSFRFVSEFNGISVSKSAIFVTDYIVEIPGNSVLEIPSVGEDHLKKYEYLTKKLDLREGIPYTPKWTAEPDFLRIIVDHCLQAEPSSVLECGSGLSTLMLARCCQMNGRGHVVSLEEGEKYSMGTTKYIERYGLEQYASVIHAPLKKISIGGNEYLWYSSQEIPDRSIDMLIVDGPSGYLQKNSRYPALPVFYPILARSCRVFLDDAARPDEQEILDLWRSDYPDLVQIRTKAIRGCVILSRGE